MLGCWADAEPALGKRWALEAMRIPQAWAFAEARGRPSRGDGIVVAQPDTGITKHAELKGVTLVSPRNLLIGIPNDPTDPLPKTAIPAMAPRRRASLLSPESLDISGSAPQAKHMPIRAIESVARLSQIKVAQAIDYAVEQRRACDHHVAWRRRLAVAVAGAVARGRFRRRSCSPRRAIASGW